MILVQTDFLDVLFYECFACIYVYPPCLCLVQKEAMDPTELVLQIVVSHHVVLVKKPESSEETTVL